LADLYDTMASDFGSSWHLTLYNDFAAMKYYDWLKRLCGMQRLRSHINLHNDLLCGRADIESVEPVESLAKLTELFRSDPLLQTFTQPGDDAAAWTQIMQDPRLRAIKKALQSHIDKYGDRGLGELKLENPTLREEPATLIHQVRVWSQTESNPDELRRREFEIRERANTTVRQQIRNPAMRAVFWFVLRNARRGISNRENMRFARTRVYGLFRKLFQQLGQVLAANETIGASSDIHYLTVGEVLALIRGANVTHDVRALIEIRKSEYAQFATESLPNRLETSAVPCQEQLSEVPDAVRHGNELSGIGCSSGLADGAAVIVDDPQTVDVAEDSILIAASTDPGWVFLMTRCKGIVVERGSLLSHTAIIGRELGIPTIVGADGAQGLIPRGAHVHMDGGTGVVQWN
jgi:pyruvate,water dikinase